MLRRLKKSAIPSLRNVGNSWSGTNAASQSPLLRMDQDADNAMQTESIIRSPDMLCAIYSLPDANPAELDAQDSDMFSENCDNTQNLDSTEDVNGFYSRCLLCTCRPDATPHLKILSDAGNELRVAEKLNKYFNIQIEPELPQRVCQSCLEKLEMTNELAICSQRARILLLQIKQQVEIFGTENDDDNQCAVAAFEHIDVPPLQHFTIKMEPSDSTDFSYSEKEPELEPNQPAMDSSAISKKSTIDIKPNQKETVSHIEQEDSESSSSAEDFDQSQPANEVKEPARITITFGKSTSKAAEVESPGLFGCIGEDGPAEEDFIKCPECSQTLYKGYMDFHIRTLHGEVEPVSYAVPKKSIQRREGSSRYTLLGVIDCSFCQLKFSSQVMDLHVSLRHTRKTYQKTPELQEETGLNRLMQCHLCPCMFYPESMQQHITEEHPPKHNPDLEQRKVCPYCCARVRICDMDQHLKSLHGPNAWRKCLHCKKRIRNTDTDIEAHLFQEHSGGIFLACRVCDGRYAKTGQEQAHMQTFLSCKYKCPLQTCKKTFVSSKSFKDHIFFFHPKIEEEMQEEYIRETNETIRLYQERCEIQEEESDDPDIQIEEISYQIEKIPSYYPPPEKERKRNNYGGRVKCDICEEMVLHKWYLIKHKNKVHNMNLTYDCVDCGKKYSKISSIFDHLKGLHFAKDKVCNICGEAFTKARYWAHMNWHERYPKGPTQRNFLDRPLDPVRCGMCNRPARNKYALLTHINAEHLDVVKERLTFHCEQCDREFANYEYLMQHNYSKHLPKIVCTYCGKLITQNRMSMHLKIHEPDRGSNYKGKKRGRKPTKAVKGDSN